MLPDLSGVDLKEYGVLRKYMGEIKEDSIPFEILILHNGNIVKVITDPKDIKKFKLEDFQDYIGGI